MSEEKEKEQSSQQQLAKTYIELVSQLIYKNIILGFIIIIFVGLYFIGFRITMITNPIMVILYLVIFLLLILPAVYTAISYKFEYFQIKLANPISDERFNKLKETTETIVSLMTVTATRMKESMEILIKMNNILNGIPNTEVLLALFTMKTKGLIFDVVEIQIEFIANSSSISADIMKRNSEKLTRNLVKIKMDYINDIFDLSKGTLDSKYKGDINDIIEEYFRDINLTIENTNLAEDKIYVTLSKMRDLDVRLCEFYKEKIQPTSFVQ